MAARYLVSGGTGNWNSTTNWSATSGGASGASFPVLGDDVFLDAASGAITLTVNVNSTCTSIDCTGFTGTLAGSSTLSISGNITLGIGMTLTYNGNLSINAAATVTNSGKVWLGNVFMTGGIITLTDNMTCQNFSYGGSSTIVNGFTIYINGNLSVTSIVSGTSLIKLNGTGTWSGAGTLRNNVTINTAGTITISGTINYNTGTLTYVAGTVVTTGSTLNIAASTTLDTNGINWNSVQLYNTAITVTNISNLNTFNLYLGLAGQSGNITFNGSPIYVTGSIIYFTSGGSFLGTTSIYAIGTGSISNSGSGGIRLCVPIIINTTGTYTNNQMSLGTGALLTYIAGTITGTNQVYIYANMNIDTNVMPITYLFIDVASTLTLNSNLNVVGTTYFNFPSTSFSLNGFTLYTYSLICFTNSLIVGGTTKIVFNGTGTWSHLNAGTARIYNNVDINTTGTLTIGANICFGVGTLKYISGTVVTTGSNLYTQTNVTLDTYGISWNNINITAGTPTINSLLTVNGALSVGSVSTVTFAGTSGFICGTFTCVTAGRTINFATGKTYTVTNNLIITGTVGSKISFVSTSTGALFNLQAGATQNVQNCNATWINSSGGQTINSSSGTLNNTINWSIGGGNFFQIM